MKTRYHLEIVQSRQPCILIERRILRLREGLLHQFRIRSAQYRIDDSRIEVCPPRRWRRVAAGGASSRIFDAPAEKALHFFFTFGLQRWYEIQR